MNRRSTLLLPPTALLALAAVPAARAHHGWGGYNAQAPLTLTGPIRSFRYDNPHGELQLEAGGKLWEVVLAPPFRMANRGLQASAFKVGEPATVMGYPHRERTSELRAEWIRVAGGAQVNLR